MLMASLKSFPHKFSEKDIKYLLDKTFDEADRNKDGLISLEDYKTLASSHPLMIDQMTIDVSKAVNERLTKRTKK